jgi:hypothetical protein
MAKEITPRSEDYSQWYLDIVQKPAWPITRRARLHGHQTARLCHLGKNARRNWMPCSRKQATSMPISRFIPKSLFELKRSRPRRRFCQRMCRGDALPPEKRPQRPGVIVDPEAKLEEELWCAQPPKPSSGILTATGSRVTATCPSSSTSGPTWCAGKCVPGRFCARRIPVAGRPHRPRQRRRSYGGNPLILDVYANVCGRMDGHARD